MKKNLLKIMNQPILRKKRTLFLTIFAVIATLFLTAATNQTDAHIEIIGPQESGISTIVFDLGDVLFRTSTKTSALTIIPTIAYNPTLLYWLIQINPKEAFFNFLETIPAQSTQPIYNKGQKLPMILADWMSGLKAPIEIKEMIEQELQNSLHPDSIKNLFSAIANLMFIPQNLANSQEIILPMAKLLKKFKQAGYQICVLSNWDAHSFEIIKNTHPKLFELCDHILISGQEKISKPNPEFYKRVLQACNVNSTACLFIDDEQHNINAACQAGFKTIHHVDALTTNKELISTGLIKICQTI